MEAMPIPASQTVPGVPYADYARLLGRDGSRITQPEEIDEAWRTAPVRPPARADPGRRRPRDTAVASACPRQSREDVRRSRVGSADSTAQQLARRREQENENT